MRYLIIIFFFISCESKKNHRVQLHVETGIDQPVKASLIHDTDDRLVISKLVEDGDFALRIDSIDAGAYRLEVEWDPRIISRQKARELYLLEIDLKPNVYTKRLFINPDQDSVYQLTLSNRSLTQSDMEIYTQQNDLQYNLILKSNSSDAMILENFLSVIRDTSIAFENLYAKELYKTQIKPTKAHMSLKDYLWFYLGYDKKVYNAQKRIMLENIDSPVIPYILYSHGHELSNIESFKPVIDKVMKRNNSVNSTYGMLLQKRLIDQKIK